MREKEWERGEEAEATYIPLIFTYLPESREMGKIQAGVIERFNIQLWSISRKKLLEFTSYIKINNEKPA